MEMRTDLSGTGDLAIPAEQDQGESEKEVALRDTFDGRKETAEGLYDKRPR